MKQNVDIPCTITVVETRPDIIEFERRAIQRDRHSLRIRLPNGQTFEALLSNLEIQKVRDVAPQYLVPQDPEPAPEEGTLVAFSE